MTTELVARQPLGLWSRVQQCAEHVIVRVPRLLGAFYHLVGVRVEHRAVNLHPPCARAHRDRQEASERAELHTDPADDLALMKRDLFGAARFESLAEQHPRREHQRDPAHRELEIDARVERIARTSSSISA